MSFLDFFKRGQTYTTEQVWLKSMAGIKAYQSHNYKEAAKLFEEYFDMKRFGKYPELDQDEWPMRCNLMLSLFYSRNYSRCIDICETLIKMNPNNRDIYAFNALAHYKLGYYTKANSLWEMAKGKSSQITMAFESIEDVKMEGFND